MEEVQVPRLNRRHLLMSPVEVGGTRLRCRQQDDNAHLHDGQARVLGTLQELLHLPRLLLRKAITIAADLLKVLAEALLRAGKLEEVETVDGVVGQIFQYESFLRILRQAQLTVDFDSLLVGLAQVALRRLEPKFADELAELVLVLVGVNELAAEVQNLGVHGGSQVICNQSIDALASR